MNAPGSLMQLLNEQSLRYELADIRRIDVFTAPRLNIVKLEIRFRKSFAALGILTVFLRLKTIYMGVEGTKLRRIKMQACI